MAAQAALGDWENIISAHINGAPLPVMMDAVRDAAIQFCRDTRIDRRLVTLLDYETTRPDLELPDGVDGEFPGTVMQLWTSEGRMDELSRQDISELYPDGWGRLTVPSMKQVKGWISLRPGSVRIVPALSVDLTGEIDVEIAYQPKRNATHLPQFLYEMYAYEIGWGALAILHAHNQASYADPAQIGVNDRRFREAITDLADKGDAGFGRRERSIKSDLF